MITTLLKAGADIKDKDPDGSNVLMCAANTQQENPKVITTLVKAGADIKNTTKDGLDRLDCRCRQNS